MALSFFSLGRICEKTMREASSMQAGTNSQPAPGDFPSCGSPV